MRTKDTLHRVKEGKRIIGCFLQTYDHFFPDYIPDKNGKSIFDLRRRTPDSFAVAVYNYFTDPSLVNSDLYQDEIEEKSAVKTFIRIKLKLLGNKFDFERMGQKWLDDNKSIFKEI